MSAPTLAEVVALLHEWFPPATAEAWDAVGLVAGALVTGLLVANLILPPRKAL